VVSDTRLGTEIGLGVLHVLVAQLDAARALHRVAGRARDLWRGLVPAADAASRLKATPESVGEQVRRLVAREPLFPPLLAWAEEPGPGGARGSRALRQDEVDHDQALGRGAARRRVVGRQVERSQ
jgi:hypothetical protein